MFKFFLILLISIFILSGCHGCSFVQDRFGKKQSTNQQIEQQKEAPQEIQSEPIPVNPSHS